ncbi:unnamed protein product [Brassica napus]|uniref:(rape) hypothetical protein n=1 Tax=Brassica napus TaxID=3708 RepID=A0A816VWX5_BRANA|nr:unnamed protein product [Brassica napus]
MQEGGWYELQNFEVAYAFGVTRVTRNRHQINLSDSSIIFKIPPLSFCHYYRFSNFRKHTTWLSSPKILYWWITAHKNDGWIFENFI